MRELVAAIFCATSLDFLRRGSARMSVIVRPAVDGAQ
jgi:hypothetical protein